MKFILLRESHDALKNEFSFLRKEPKYLKIFKKFYTEENKSMDGLKALYDKIKTHRNTLKQNKIDLTRVENYEQAWDLLVKAETIEKFNKFTKLLPSTLRKNVRSSDRFKEKFKEVINGFDYDDYKNNFLKKVAKYRDPHELIVAAENYLKSAKPRFKVIADIEKNPQAKVWHIDENTVIAMIYSREASCALGSQNWCIAGSDGGSWDDYIVKDPVGVQYFVWDFTEGVSSNESLLGVTLYSKGDDKKPRKTPEFGDANYFQDEGDEDEDWEGEMDEMQNVNGYNLIAQDKSDSPIQITGRDWFGTLDTFNELETEDKERYMMYNQGIMGKINLDTFSDNFKKRYFLENPEGAVRNFQNIEFLSDEEVVGILDKHPKIVKHQMFYSRIDTESKKRYQKQYFVQGNYVENPEALIQEFSDLEFLTDREVISFLDQNAKIIKYPIFHNRVDMETKKKYQREYFLKGNYAESPLKLMDEFSDLDFLPQEDVDKIVEEHPELLTIEMFYRRVSPEKVKAVIIASPQKAHKFDTEFLNGVIDSMEDYIDMTLNLLNGYTNFGGYSYEKEFKAYYDKYPKLDFYYNDDFLKKLFEKDISICLRMIPGRITEFSLEEINNMFKADTENWAKALNEGGHKIQLPLYKQIKSYFKTGTWKRFERNEFYVFNARMVKKEVGTNPRNGKKTYEEVLELETFLKFHPFRNSNVVSGLKMRAMAQGDLKTYGLWVDKGLFGGSDQVHDLADYGDGLMDIIQSRMVKL